MNVAKTISEIQSLLNQYEFESHILTKTNAGDVIAYHKCHNPSLPYIHLSAGIHGDEPASTLALLEFLRIRPSQKVNWLIVPLLNPAGMHANTRENPAGIDLNRDYQHSSSDEVKAHIAWLNQMPVPQLHISLHEDWEATGFYFYEINKSSNLSFISEKILQNVASILPIDQSPTIDDHLVHEPGWIFHSPQSDYPNQIPEAIHLANLGCPLSFTLETPSNHASLDKRIAAHKIAVETIIESYTTTEHGSHP